MNQLINATPRDQSPICADLTMMAERELAAFVAATTELFGPEQAALSAEDWLREVSALHGLPSSTREWRQITLNASTRVASRVNVPSL